MTGRGQTDQAEELLAAHAAARQRAEGGDLTGARTLIEDALASGELQLGREDPRLAPLMVDLATLARKLGNLTEARNQLRRAYAIIVASVGPEHATSLSIEGRLAAVIYRLGEPTEAYDWHLSDAGRRVLGTEHPAVRGAQQRLAASAQSGPPPAPAPPPEPPSIGWVDAVGDHQGWAPAETATYAPIAAGVYQRQPEVHVLAPPPREPDDIEVWHEPPLATGDVSVRRKRGHGGGVALVASLGVIILVAAIVVAAQFLRATSDGGRPSGTSSSNPNTVIGAPPPTAPVTPTAPPPTGVKIKDEGGSVTLTWEDPSGGRIEFIVSGAQAGTPMTALDRVSAGRTAMTIYGLNDKIDYCFTVSAVWTADKITPSMRTCTSRISTSSSA